ncbi:MAG: hypothetical protein LBF24_00475, partial [Puniceicoccales bacterium]|nr:hypothetical protein [Puniceicoccales bacterium]
MQSAVGKASNGDTLLFPESTFVFGAGVSVEGGKSLGLWGAGLSESGQPLTVLEKSDACRFFNFAGDGGGGSGIRSIAFNGKERTFRGDGGAIYCNSSFIGDILNSSFAGNSAGGNGGAICCYFGSFTGDIQSSSFAGNGAGGIGGAIRCSGFTGDILSSSFAGNGAGWNGGAINCNGNFTGAVQSSSFVDNYSVSGWGGAIRCGSFTGKDDAFADLGGSRFLQNYA